MSVLQQEFFVSGIIWIPYSLLLFYLFCEHYVRARNLQSNILLLLTIGAVFRTTWFWVKLQIYYVYAEFINRIAMLLQFSALSLLMLMWNRAIAISKLTDVVFAKDAVHDSQNNSDNLKNYSRARVMLEKYKAATQSVFGDTNAFKSYFQFSSLLALLVNISVWGFVLGSLASNTYLWYNINIIGISMACLLAAIGTLFVGLRVSITLQKALSPIYISNAGATGYNQEQSLKCVCLGQYGARCEYMLGCCGLFSLYSFIFNFKHQCDLRQGLHMQREVLKVILSVSAITSIFFLLRGLCFMYRPIIEE
jgi:hypothetical protein